MDLLDKSANIFVAGHHGLVGSAIVRALRAQGYSNLLLRRSSELDLRNQESVHQFFLSQKPHYVFLAAAKVGGILANDSYPAEFLYDNLSIASNVIHAAHLAKVSKLLFLGSTCIYPKMAPQPLKEDYLLTGPLEPTNEWYAIAKIAGIKLCQAYQRQYGCRFISAMPTNLYGPGDNFDLTSSHVLPALIRKFHEAKRSGAPSVTVWGSGTPRREFLHADDCAAACLHLMKTYNGNDIVNIGWGKDISIAELAETVRATVGYRGRIEFDRTKPDGTPRKLVDNRKLLSLGWHPSISLEEGLRLTYEWFQTHDQHVPSA